MLKKRIIPCLDIQDGRVVKGIHFKGIKDAGDPIELARRYVQEGADELVFLDIAATIQKRKTLVPLVQKIAAQINIPFTVGGGISSVADAKAIIHAGADKISVNSSALRQPQLITALANELGSQCVVLAIDTKWVDGDWWVYSSGGNIPTTWKAIDWAQQGTALGAGEILLTSMNNDGAQNGFALSPINAISRAVTVPIIASGGAGSMAHFLQLFTQTNVGAALAASVFHYQQIHIAALKQFLYNQNIPIRL